MGVAELDTCRTNPHGILRNIPYVHLPMQAELCRKVALALGFNLEKGRLDVSVHPFTGGECPQQLPHITCCALHQILM